MIQMMFVVATLIAIRALPFTENASRHPVHGRRGSFRSSITVSLASLPSSCRLDARRGAAAAPTVGAGAGVNVRSRSPAGTGAAAGWRRRR